MLQCREGGAKVSSVMSLMTCMMPLSYTSIYPLTGPLVTLTGVEATPLYMGAAACFLAAFSFMFYRNTVANPRLPSAYTANTRLRRDTVCES